jgi:glycosyltransferase involved in cell wall biosynthesis
VKIALALHGWPPAGTGGVERSVRCLAHALARAGHEVCVLSAAGTRAAHGRVECAVEREAVPDSDASIEILRLARPDLYFDHWQKSRSPEVAALAAEILRERRCDVLHVQHWLNLSRDLVHAAAGVGVPAVVTLHDAWTSCALAFRVRTSDRATCDAIAAGDPCVACAGRMPPFTPWVDRTRAWMALAERQRDLLRELELARAVTVPTASHGAAMERGLGLPAGALGATILPPMRVALAARASGAAPPRFSGSGALRLASWGSLAEHKGVDLVLAALARAGAAEDFALDLLGTGTPAVVEELREQSAGLDVRFHGAFEPEELLRGPAARAHAFVSGTRAVESYGIVLDEAFELGLPVVVPDQDAFLERCGPRGADGSGDGALYYARGDEQALAAALVRLRSEPGLHGRLSAGARARGERSRAAASEHAGLRAHEELYARAVARGAPKVRPAEWFEARLASAELTAWDESLARCSATQLGLAR